MLDEPEALVAELLRVAEAADGADTLIRIAPQLRPD
jgi:hypothetical protein